MAISAFPIQTVTVDISDIADIPGMKTDIADLENLTFNTDAAFIAADLTAYPDGTIVRSEDALHIKVTGALATSAASIKNDWEYYALPSIAAFKASVQPARGVGEIWEVSGGNLVEADPSATDADATNNAGTPVKAYISDYATTSVAIGAEDTSAFDLPGSVIRASLKSSAAFSATEALANKNILDACIERLPEGGRLEISPASNPISIYALAEITKGVDIDLGGNRYLWDSTDGDDAAYVSEATDFDASDIRPLIRYAGPSVQYAQTSTPAKGDTSFVVSAETAAALSPGDVIYLRSSDQYAFWNTPLTTGTYGGGETNVVNGISGTTLTVQIPLRFAYTTSFTLDLLSLSGGHVHNGVIHEQSVSARYGGNVGGSLTPNIIRFENCTNRPRVTGVEFENVNVSCVSVSGCHLPLTQDCHLRKAQRQNEGGHGNLFKAQDRFSEGALVMSCTTYLARHLVDWTNAHNSRSTLCVGTRDSDTYTWHGFGTDNCWSINDTANYTNPVGWGVGRNQFGKDTNVKIINPMGISGRRGIMIYGATDGVEVIGGSLVVDGQGSNALAILIIEAAKNVTIDGFAYRLGSGDLENNLIWMRQYFSDGLGSDEQFTDKPSNVTIRNGDFELNGSRSAIFAEDCDGYLSVIGNRYKTTDTTTCEGLRIDAGISASTVIQSLFNTDILTQSGTHRLKTVDNASTNTVTQHDFNSKSDSSILTDTPFIQSNIGAAEFSEFTELVSAGSNSSTVISANSDDRQYEVTIASSSDNEMDVYQVWQGATATRIALLGTNGAGNFTLTLDGSDNVVVANSAGSSLRANVVSRRLR